MTTPQTISDARLHANRANSRFSTGPKTEEGKAASRQNSRKHGAYSKQLIVPGEDPADLDALKADLHAEHQPDGVTETLLVEEIAEQYWRLKRARRMEADLLAQPDFSLSHLAAIQRLMNSSDRGFHKALKTLRELQSARGFVPHKLLNELNALEAEFTALDKVCLQSGLHLSPRTKPDSEQETSAASAKASSIAGPSKSNNTYHRDRAA